jgi:hypothetical protein
MTMQTSKAALHRFIAAILALLTLLMLTTVAPARAGDDERDPPGRRIVVVDPGQTLFGKSYPQLIDAWSNWLAQEPVATNPALDNTGQFCARNQQGRIWFLAGTFGGVFGEDAIAKRRCQVPAGKALFFALFSRVSFAPEFPEAGNVCAPLGSGVAGVRCDVNDEIPLAPDISLTVTLDGRPVRDLLAFRAQSTRGGFLFRIGTGSPLTLFGVTPGMRFPAVSDGYWLFLAPPPPGPHTVHFSVDFDPAAGNGPEMGAMYDVLIGRSQ